MPAARRRGQERISAPRLPHDEILHRSAAEVPVEFPAHLLEPASDAASLSSVTTQRLSKTFALNHGLSFLAVGPCLVVFESTLVSQRYQSILTWTWQRICAV